MQMPTTQTISAEQRARTSDPNTSHLAAETSAKSLSRLQAIVLEIVEGEGATGITDSELDAYYSLNALANGWPIVRYETPRKRRSDLTPSPNPKRRRPHLERLCDSGIRRPNKFGALEVVWVIAS